MKVNGTKLCVKRSERLPLQTLKSYAPRVASNFFGNRWQTVGEPEIEVQRRGAVLFTRDPSSEMV